MMVKDKVVQKLEDSGLWRRAAARWLDVMQHGSLSDEQRDWIRQRRKYCLSRVFPVVPTEKLDIRDVARAADKTLAEMGIVNVNGAVFRHYRKSGE